MFKTNVLRKRYQLIFISLGLSLLLTACKGDYTELKKSIEPHPDLNTINYYVGALELEKNKSESSLGNRPTTQGYLNYIRENENSLEIANKVSKDLEKIETEGIRENGKKITLRGRLNGLKKKLTEKSSLENFHDANKQEALTVKAHVGSIEELSKSLKETVHTLVDDISFMNIPNEKTIADNLRALKFPEDPQKRLGENTFIINESLLIKFIPQKTSIDIHYFGTEKQDTGLIIYYGNIIKEDSKIIPFIIKISADKTVQFNGYLSTIIKNNRYRYNYRNIKIKDDNLNGQISATTNKTNYLIDFTNRLHEENGKVHRF